MSLFSLKKISEMHRDCTSNYQVIFDGPATVDDLIESVITEHPQHFGTIYVIDAKYRDKCVGANEVIGRIDYRHGTIEDDQISEELRQKSINEARANGGYGIMSYDVFV